MNLHRMPIGLRRKNHDRCPTTTLDALGTKRFAVSPVQLARAGYLLHSGDAEATATGSAKQCPRTQDVAAT